MIILISFLVFLTVVTAMAVGVIFSHKPIKGSCGGLANIGLKGDCDICGRKQDEPPAAKIDDRLFTDASKASKNRTPKKS